MSKLARFIEELLLPIIVAISLLVSIADLFGLFHLIPPGSVPMLTLILVSLALNALAVIQKRTAEINERTQLLLSNISIEQMAKEAIEQIDPVLRKVLQDDYFLDVVGFLDTAIRESKVPVNDIARLRFYYIRTLKCFQRATFLSTNSSSAFTLWEDHAIEKATTEFISKGGIMKQIFFVKNDQERSLPTTQAKIVRMQQMGVRVHIVNSAATPGDMKKNFIVESRGKIAWEMRVDDDGHVGSSIVTTNQDLTTSYCRTFEKLLQSEIRN
jgi:hypothetical protein